MKKYLVLVYSILLIVVAKNLVDSTSCLPSNLELDLNHTRREYLGNGLGLIYKNFFGVIFFNNLYPVVMKFERSFFSDLSKPLIYISLFVSLFYMGHKRHNEK